MVIVYIYYEFKKCGRQAIYIHVHHDVNGLRNDMSDAVSIKVLQLQIRSEKDESERCRID